MKFAAFQNPAVTALLQKLFNAQVPVRTAYKLSKIQKAVAVESERYQNLRMKIIKKFGTKDEQGQLIVDDNGNAKLEDSVIEAVTAEMKELHDLVVELPEKIKIDDLANVQLSATDLSVLDTLEILDTE